MNLKNTKAMELAIKTIVIIVILLVVLVVILSFFLGVTGGPLEGMSDILTGAGEKLVGSSDQFGI